MSFRENLRFVLDSQGILIKELSLKTDISENTLKSYLKESSAEPTLAKASSIAAALNVSLDYLATGVQNSSTTNENPVIAEINSYMKKFNTNDLNAVLNITKALNEKY